MSEVSAEKEPDFCLNCGSSLEVCPIRGACRPRVDGWPECDFENCYDPASFRRKDRFGVEHRACTGHQETLDRWVRIHNGWEEGEEGMKEGGSA